MSAKKGSLGYDHLGRPTKTISMYPMEKGGFHGMISIGPQMFTVFLHEIMKVDNNCKVDKKGNKPTFVMSLTKLPAMQNRTSFDGGNNNYKQGGNNNSYRGQYNGSQNFNRSESF
jgi:hypothetical protein